VPHADPVSGEEGTPAFEAARPVGLHSIAARVEDRVEGAVRDGAGGTGTLERGAVACEFAPNEKAPRHRGTAARSARREADAVARNRIVEEPQASDRPRRRAGAVVEQGAVRDARGGVSAPEEAHVSRGE